MCNARVDLAAANSIPATVEASAGSRKIRDNEIDSSDAYPALVVKIRVLSFRGISGYNFPN